MKRFLEQELRLWQNRDAQSHLPLIVRGARQVGKTYLIEQCGRDHFQNMVVINFELQKQAVACFQSLDPLAILSRLKIVLGADIQAGKTLLFLDEIQECPEALQSLRYFKEKLPALHVIAAGSLLEFSLHEEEDFSFPVGRIEYLYLRPLSFGEFLFNRDQGASLEMLKDVTLQSPLDESLHEHYLRLVRQYLWVGGMPAVVQQYFRLEKELLKSSDLSKIPYQDCQRLQAALLQSYYNDFGKYAKKTQYRYLQRMFERAPLLVGQHFKYSSVDVDMRARELKIALEQLEYMGLVQRVYASSASGFPLKSQKKEDKYKLLFLDVGLVQQACQVGYSAFLDNDILKIHAGVMAEQFVGQELVAYSESYQKNELYFWQREKKSSMAEVDFLMEIDGHIIPIEVKAGKTGRLKSLQVFMQEKHSPVGLRISQAPLSFHKGVLSVPFYLIMELPRLLREVRM